MLREKGIHEPWDFSGEEELGRVNGCVHSRPVSKNAPQDLASTVFRAFPI